MPTEARLKVADFDRLSLDLRKAVMDGLSDSIIRAARPHLPKDTGALQRSARYRVAAGGKSSVISTLNYRNRLVNAKVGRAMITGAKAAQPRLAKVLPVIVERAVSKHTV